MPTDTDTITVYYPTRPGGRGWTRGDVKLAAVPEVGSPVVVLVAIDDRPDGSLPILGNGHYEPFTVVPSPWVERANAAARERTARTTFRVSNGERTFDVAYAVEGFTVDGSPARCYSCGATETNGHTIGCYA